MSLPPLINRRAPVFLLLLAWSSSALIGKKRVPWHSRRTNLSSTTSAPRIAASAAKDPTEHVGDATTTTYDPISDWVRPPPDVIQRARDERISPMTALASPVFFSTDAGTGRRVRGLSRVPTPEAEAGEDGRPRAVLFVSNHQLVGIDSWMVVSELIQQRSIHARSLAHPLVFTPGASGGGGGGLLSTIVENGMTTNAIGRNSDDDASSTSSSSFDFLESFGGVRVSPRNLYRLMETGQPTLLFPGGARESFRNRDQGYALESWPSDNRSDFVRVAAKFDATIVPFSSVGAAESAYFIADPPEDVSRIPFGLGNAVANWMGENVPFDARWDSGEVLALPLVMPKPVPARHAYLFHAPIRLSEVDHRDRRACRDVYRVVKTEIRHGITDLLRAGEKDPYRDSARRLVYERVWRKQAPTFPLGELNKR